jgi:hypothetical protein
LQITILEVSAASGSGDNVVDVRCCGQLAGLLAVPAQWLSIKVKLPNLSPAGTGVEPVVLLVRLAAGMISPVLFAPML